MQNLNRMKVSGFTLVELIITVAILAILMSMAIPSFQKMLERNQVTTTSNDMLASFLLARSEAVTRDQNMVVAKIGNWNNGWRVTNTAGTVLLELRTSHPNLTVTNKGANTSDSLTYTAQGRTSPALVAGTDFYEITLGDTTRCVNFSTTGRPSVGDCS